MITRDLTIDELFVRYPQKAERLAQALANAGLSCVGCHAATFETLEAGMLSHGMDDSAIDELIKELNTILEAEEPPPESVTITPRAADKYRSILQEENKKGWGLRFTEKPGGCHGYEYALDYSKKALETDISFLSQGIELHVPKVLLSRLLGAEIDYLDGLHGSGFKITNPNVRSSCGCGSSHGY